MEQNWYRTKFYFIGLLALILSLFNTSFSNGQCINVRDPQTNQWTNQPRPWLRCPALADPIPGTITIQFQSPASNFTIDWGNGDIQTYPGPQTSISYTYATAAQFKFRIAFPGCPDSLKGIYVNDRNLTAGGVSVPGVGFIVPPAGVTNKRCVPEDLTIINGSPGMNGYTRWIVEWGDNKIDTIGNDFMRSYTHTYQRGTTGCSLQIRVTYLNACGVNPINRPRAGYGDYFFKDIDSAAVTPASVILCAPTDVLIQDRSKLNCLDSADRQLLWTRISGFAAPLPYPGDNVFRTYNATNRRMLIPTAAFYPIPPDSTYNLRMVIRNTCGDDSADATIRIVSPTKPVFSVINNNTCPGEQMNFSNLTSHRPYQTYRVDFGDGTVVNLGYSAIFSHTYLVGGTYKVKMSSIVGGYNGQTCGLSDSIFVQVKTTVTPRVQVTPLLGCDTMTVLVKNLSINTAGVVWRGWDLGQGMTAGTGVMPTLINTAQAQVMSVNLSDSTAIIRYKEHGRYTIRLRAQSLGCPELSDADTIYIYPSPTLRWRVSPAVVCQGNSITIRDSSRVMQTNQKNLFNNWNHISWRLEMGDGTVYQSSSNITNNFDNVQGTNRLTGHTYANPGQYWVKLIVRSPNRCPKVDSVRITVLPATTPSFKWKRDICNPGLITFMNTTPGMAQRYEYVIRRGANIFARLTRTSKDTFDYALPYFPPGDSTFYYVNLRAVSGTSPDTCVASTAQFLIKIPPVKVANFSASALDGCTPINDVLFVNQSIGIPTDGTHTYQWNFGNGNTFTGENPPLQNFVNTGSAFRRDTVRLRIVSNGGCVYTAQKVITIYPLPNPSIVAPSSICHNTPVTFSATGNGLGSYNWSFAEVDGTNSTQANPTKTMVNTGTLPVQYIIRLLVGTVAGCVDSASKAIVVHPLPTAVFTANPEAACGSTPVAFDASGSQAAATYTWSFSDGTAGIVDTNAAVAVRVFPQNLNTTDRTYNITLTTKSSQGCTGLPSSRVVRIRPTVKAAFIADVRQGCSPLSVNFQNLSTQSDDNYTWYVNELGAPGLGVPSLPNRPNRGFFYNFINNSYSTVARFVVTLVVRDDNGIPVCEDQFKDTITVFPKPLAAFVRTQVNPSTLCAPVSMRVKATGSQGAANYTWTFSDGALPIFATDSIPFFKTFFNTTTTIRPEWIQLLVSNSFGCADSVRQNMNIRPRVSAAFTASNTMGCSPLTTTFNNQSSSSAISFTWYRNGVPFFFNRDLPPQQFVNNSPTDTAVYQIYLVARGEGDVCTDTSAVRIIRVLPKPQVVASVSPANGCSPLSVQLDATGTVGGQQFMWFVKGGSQADYTLLQNGNSPAPFSTTLNNSTGAPVNFTLKLLVRNAGGCEDSVLRNITVFPDVAPSFTASRLNGCAPLPITFTNTSGEPLGTSLVWKINGVPQFNPNPQTFNNIFTSQSDTAPTTYQVSLQLVSSSGCSREQSQTITVFPQPNPDFAINSTPLAGCSPVAARFFPAITGSFSKLTWVFDGADSIQTAADTSIRRNYFNSGLVPFTQTIRLTAENAQGCNRSVQKNLVVNPRVRAGFVQSAQEGCSPLRVKFTNSGSTGANLFEWYVDGILVSNVDSSIFHTFTNGSFSQTRTYTIKLVAKNSLAPGCVDTATRFVTIYRKPTVEASAFPNSGCSPLRTQFSASNSQGGVLYEWYRKESSAASFALDTVTNSGQAFVRRFINTGSSVRTIDIKVVVTGADGCKDSAQFSVNVVPGLTASFNVSPDTAGCAPFVGTFANATASAAANSFQWLVDGVNVSNSPAFFTYNFQNTSATSAKVYEVKLVASNATYGCPDTVRRLITAWPKPLVDLSIALNPTTACSPVVASFSPANHQGVQQFTWLLPDTLITLSDSTVNRTFVNNTVVPQLRWVTLEGRNAFGCTATKSSNFQVNPGVKANFMASRDSVCSPAEIVFTNTSSSGVNAVEWYIDGVFKGNSLSTITELFVNNDSLPKVYRIRLVARNSVATACQDTISKVITVFPRPIPGNIFANPENGCSPLAVQMTGSAVFAQKFVWDFGDGSQVDTTVQSLSHTFQNFNSAINAQYTVTQTAINAYGCQASTSTVVNVRPNVKAGIVRSDSVGCSPVSVSFSGASSVNANQYQWDFGGGVAATGVNVTRMFVNNSDTSRVFPVRLIVDRAGVGCPDTAYTQIVVHPQPIAEFEANPAAGCQPLQVQFANNSVRASAGYWVLTYGPQIDTVAGLNGFTRTFSNSTPLNQVVRAELFVASAQGCKASQTRLITVSPFVKADFVQSVDSGCSPLAVNFTNLSAPGASASWFVDGVLVNNSTGQFPYTFVNNGQFVRDFKVKLLVASVLNSGCSDTLVRTLRVFPKPIAGVLGAVPDNGCSPVNISLFSNAVGATRYLYDFNDGQIADTNSASISHTFVNNASLTTRNFNIRLVVRNAFGCTDNANRIVSIKPTVTAVITSPDSVGCTPLSLSLSGLNSVNSNLYDWDFGDGTGSVLATPTKVFTNTSDTIQQRQIRLITDRTGVGCPDTAFFNLTLYPKPAVEFAPNPMVGCNPLPVQISNLTTGAVSATWTFSGNGQTHSFPAVGAQFDTTFVNDQSNLNMVVEARLTAVNALGCTDTRTRNITIFPAVKAAFVQNADSGCSPLRVRFTNQSLPGNLVTWMVDGQVVSASLTNFDFTFVNTGLTSRTFEIKMIARAALAGECTDTIKSYVTVYPKPNAGVINALPEIACSPARIDFVGTAIGATAYNWNFGDGSELDTTAQEVFHVFSNTNSINNRNFRVRLIARNEQGCTDTAFRNVTIRPLVRAVIASNDTAGCTPFLASFSASQSFNANQFEWDFGGLGGSTFMNTSFTFVNNSDSVETHVVRLVARRSGVECADTASYKVKVFPKPTAAFALTPTAGCQPLAVSLTNQSELMTSSLWQFVANGVQTEVAAIHYDTVVGNASAQIKTVRVILNAFSQHGCVSRLERQFTVAPFVKADFVQSVDSGCSPLRVNFVNLSSAGASPSWFVDGNPVSSSSGSFNFTFLNNSNVIRVAEVMLVVRNNLVPSCTDTIRRKVYIFPKPNAGIVSASPESGCSPLLSTFSAQPNFGQSYLWDFRDGTTLETTSLNVSHTFVNYNPSANMNFNVMFVVISDKGCTDTSYKAVTVSPFTVARIGLTDSVGCSPLTIQLAGALSQNANRFTWDFGDGSNPSLVANPVKTFTNTTQQEAVYNVRLIASRNGFNCPDTAYKTIRVFPNPRAVFSASAYNGCGPLPVQFVNNSELAAKNRWIISSLAGVDTLYTSASTWDTVFSNPFPQQMNVRVELQVETIYGCTHSLVRNILVNPDVKAEFATTADGCSPLLVQFTNLSTNPGGGFQWNFGDGSPFSAVRNPSHVFTYNGPTDTTYMVTLLAISNPVFSPACNKTVTMPVRVFSKPRPDFLMNPEVLQLPDRVVTFSNLTPHRPSWKYKWVFGDGRTDTSSSLTVSNDYSSLLTELSNTNVNVKLVAYNDQGCADSVTKVLQIRPIKPIVDFEPDTGGCAPLIVRFRNKSKYGNSYFWTFGDGTTSTEQNPSKRYEQAGVYSVSLRVTGPGGEAVLKRDNLITVFEQPDASFTTVPRAPRALKIPEEKMNCFVRYPQPGWTYEWDFGDGTTSSQKDPVHQYKQPGTYTITLKVTSLEGCVDHDTLRNGAIVEKGNLIIVPNAFTPRTESASDGYLDREVGSNDIFYPFTEGVTEIRLQIFNRWGQFLYESTTLNKGWDGTYNGSQCKSDVYVYKIWCRFVDGRTETKVGDVTLLR